MDVMKRSQIDLSPEEMSNRLNGLCEAIPKPIDLLASIPDGILRHLAFYAVNLASKHSSDGQEIDAQDILDWMGNRRRPKTIPRKSAAFTYYFRVALEGLCTGYLGTQYFFLGALDEVRVDLSLLQEKIGAKSQPSTNLLFCLPPQLDLFLTNLNDRTRQFEIPKRPRKGFDEAAFEDILLLSVSWGAILWQEAESVWLGRSVGYRGSKTVFLSYSTADRLKVRKFDKELREFGLSTWLDEKTIRFGEDILDVVSEGIAETADYLLIFLSPNSLNSEWVRLETRVAYDRQLTLKRPFLIPVLLTDTVVPKHLRIKKYADARKNVSKCARQVAQVIIDYIKDQPVFG